MTNETLTQTDALLPSGETHFEAARRYNAEHQALQTDPTVSKHEIEAKGHTAQYLTRVALEKNQLPVPTGEPNTELDPYVKP